MSKKKIVWKDPVSKATVKRQVTKHNLKSKTDEVSFKEGDLLLLTKNYSADNQLMDEFPYLNLYDFKSTNLVPKGTILMYHTQVRVSEKHDKLRRRRFHNILNVMRSVFILGSQRYVITDFSGLELIV